MMKPHHPQNRKKEGRKRGRKEGEIGGRGEERREGKGEKKEDQADSCGLRGARAWGAFSQAPRGSRCRHKSWHPTPSLLRAGGQGPTVRKPSHNQKRRTMGKQEKCQARVLSDPGWRQAQPPASFLHPDASPSLITILAQSLVFPSPWNLLIYLRGSAV
uniref:Uncharacterized protein n=1 Tax=Myotis myotis TaxID=51298 RepID=A0A7J7SCV2_MYOMY|nr:hypothetical protein mMyoMyo1_009533 [Myotis myotis]